MMYGVSQFGYLVASALFIFALHWMNTPATARKGVYAGVAGLESFEPYLTRLENLDTDLLEDAAAAVPPEWYAGATDELGALLQALASRRRKVVSLLLALRDFPKRPFPNWRDS